MKQIAVYAGSFDPFTNGHLDIVKRVQPLFDTVHMVVAVNPRKATLFSAQERVNLIQSTLDHELPKQSFVVSAHEGLIVDYCKDLGAKVMVRGLRALSDFESELQMSSMNRKLNSNIETLHMMTDEKFFFLSSTLVKEIAAFAGPLSDIVPKFVEQALRQKFPHADRNSRKDSSKC
jgi:pantetheine-phosphate adenylyltransferase